MFTYFEDFKRFDENYKPYGIFIEACSSLWHNHALPVADGYSIACTGNRYFLITPKTGAFKADFSYRFGVLHKYAGVSFFFGYSPETHDGFELRAEWKKEENTLSVRLIEIASEARIDRETKTVTAAFPESYAPLVAAMSYGDGKLTLELGSAGAFAFDVATKAGYVGFSRPNFVGEVTFSKAVITLEEQMQALRTPVKVEIPTVNGGIMPLNVTYELFAVGEQHYLKATLDGGPQDLEHFDKYPCNKRGQYCVERWFMECPYIKYGGQRYEFSRNELNLHAPGLAWQEILEPMMNFSKLPLAMTVPVKGKGGNFSFGYEKLAVSCYGMQAGKAEFNFSADGTYLGQTAFPDTFSLHSPAEKQAVRMIPDTVFEADTVRAHFAKNHYFAEGEPIEFEIVANSDKQYLSYRAELQNIYGDKLEELAIEGNKLHHASLPVGLYRVMMEVLYGDALLQKIDTVFEVFDPNGQKCAPLESGLPFMFSMPNEQQYLDRDPFDPWNNGDAGNAEHYYACTAFTGHVAEYKRTWEVTKRFGRQWYVWLSSNRTMCGHDYKEHMDILKNADYIYYPSEYEWSVLRSDFNLPHFWGWMPKTRALLDEFLDAREGARERLGYERGGKVTKDVIAKLYAHYGKEWRKTAQKAIKEGFSRQNELFRRYNPNFKRACYGPFNVYTSTMRTYKESEMYGFETGDTLSDVIYTGFAQFEDYPASCAYQTYRGAFGVGTTLTNAPRLTIYPEQYTTSRGGIIDGAVYFAHPPIGAYRVPLWFNTTHAREYVYNTPIKTPDGFRYWSTYGFMNADFSPEETEAFVRDWGYVLKHKPERPLKATVFISSFTDADDRYEGSYPGWRAEYNISEEGVGYLYETSRLLGLPHGFFANWDALDTLNATDIDLLVLPSTEGLAPEKLQKLRELYRAGVALFAVSRVDGLEDIFGVEYAPETQKIYQVSVNGETEAVYPYQESALYRAAGADCLMTAAEMPAVLQKGRAALLNVPCRSIGRTYFYRKDDNGRDSNSKLLRRVVSEVLNDLSVPLAKSDGCGITLFRDTEGRDMLLAIDYSRHDESEINRVNEYTVHLNSTSYTTAIAIDGKPLRRLISQEGILEGIVVGLRQHESALIQLK